jgi:hypothetical protein
MEWDDHSGEYQWLLNDFYGDVDRPTITDSEAFKETIKDLCADGVISVDGTINNRPRSVGSNSMIVHGDYVAQTEEQETSDETAEFGGVDTGATTSGAGSPSTGQVGASGSTGTSGTTGGVGGTSSSGSNSQTDEQDTEAEESETTTTTFPPMPPLEADNKFSLVDELERQMGSDWEVHHLTVGIEASLSDDDLVQYGLDGYTELANRTEIDEELTMDASDAPLSKRRVLDIVEDLDVPQVASLSVRMEVDKNE